jgi:hypothetical protein
MKESMGNVCYFIRAEGKFRSVLRHGRSLVSAWPTPELAESARRELAQWGWDNPEIHEISLAKGSLGKTLRVF